MWTRITLGALAVLVACGVLASVADAASGVVWDVRSSANSTVAPGGSLTFYVWATNVGSVASDGSTVTMNVSLPAGMTLASATPRDPAWDCSGAVAGASSVACTASSAIAAQPTGPGQFSQLGITVNVDPNPAVSAGVRSVHYTLSGGGAATAASADDPTRVTSEPLGFGVEAFDGQVADAGGGAFTQAGGHPDSVSTEIDFNRGDDPSYGALWPPEPIKDVAVDLPPGFIGNPTAATQCTAAQLANSNQFEALPLCPTSSQVGVVTVTFNRGLVGWDQRYGPVSVFNMVPPPDAPARFGFNLDGSVVTLDGRLRSSGDYGVSVDVKNTPEALALLSTELTLWGTPADPAHDVQRSCPGKDYPFAGGPTCTTDAPHVPFLRNPTSCTPPAGSPVSDGLITSLHIDSWDHPGAVLADGSPDLTDSSWKNSQFVSHQPPGYPASPDDPSTPWGPHVLPTGCDKVPFDPALAAGPTGGGGTPSTPSAFSFDLSLPQNNILGGIAEGDLRKAVVTLPAGVRVSPSSAQGLAGCSSAQIALHSTADPACPDGSKQGTVTITTPLLDQPIQGTIYLATPYDNPAGNLLSIYLVAKGSGIIIKLAGKIDADPATGQLTATFDDNPQTPFDNVHLEFDGGPRAALATPDVCGTYTTTAQMTSWSGKTVDTTSPFTISSDGHGGACAPRGFAPSFHAGTQNPVAGASTPFLMQLSRDESSQQIGGLTVQMPRGVLGKIKNATLCSENDAAHGTCGDASKVGNVTVGAGAGPNPFYITNGRAYITGPYKGGPFGLSIVVPAVAGPFNLGDVNVRASIQVDRSTAALKVVSDPLPTILQGIPLDVRDIRVAVDKSDFIVNPTNCDAKSVQGAITSTDGVTAHDATRFQVGNCSDLALAPKMTLTVGSKGHTANGATTPFSTTITMPKGDANLRKVSVTLPAILNARLGVVNNACTLDQFHAGNCEKAKAGTAVATTPLLKDPLRGGVYFVKNGRPLPDLMVALRGQVSLDLDGKVTIPGSTHLATTFDTIPDAPVTSFTLRLVSGSHGPIGTTANLCSAKARKATAAVGIRGQNGKLIRANQHLRILGCPKAKPHKKKK